MLANYGGTTFVITTIWVIGEYHHNFVLLPVGTGFLGGLVCVQVCFLLGLCTALLFVD